jgi:hypothetical protein
MSDDEESLPALASPHDRELLLYDYFKHLTTLALLALGGVLTVSQMADPGDIKPVMLVIVLAVIGLGGIASFAGGSEIVSARYTGARRTRSIALCRKATPALLTLGVGMFLYLFVDTLN